MKFDDGESYLKRDLSIKCWSASHLSIGIIVGIPFITVWIVAFPLFMWFIIRKHRHNLANKEIILKYGFFYVGLNDSAFFWEVTVSNVRKVLFIVFTTVFQKRDSNYKVKIQQSLTYLLRLYLVLWYCSYSSN